MSYFTSSTHTLLRTYMSSFIHPVVQLRAGVRDLGTLINGLRAPSATVVEFLLFGVKYFSTGNFAFLTDGIELQLTARDGLGRKTSAAALSSRSTTGGTSVIMSLDGEKLGTEIEDELVPALDSELKITRQPSIMTETTDLLESLLLQSTTLK